jgi:hypothetical protein
MLDGACGRGRKTEVHHILSDARDLRLNRVFRGRGRGLLGRHRILHPTDQYFRRLLFFFDLKGKARLGFNRLCIC